MEKRLQPKKPASTGSGIAVLNSPGTGTKIKAITVPSTPWQDALFLTAELAGPNSRNYHLFGFFVPEGTTWASIASRDYR